MDWWLFADRFCQTPFHHPIRKAADHCHARQKRLSPQSGCALNACYRGSRALWDIDDGWDGFTWLNVDDAERSAIAFLRTARNGRRVVCVCNFTPVRYDDFVIGLPKRGVLRELLSSDSEEFGGSGVHNVPEIRSEDVPFGALPCSARVTLPELATVYFTFTNR